MGRASQQAFRQAQAEKIGLRQINLSLSPNPTLPSLYPDWSLASAISAASLAGSDKG